MDQTHSLRETQWVWEKLMKISWANSESKCLKLCRFRRLGLPRRGRVTKRRARLGLEELTHEVASVDSRSAAAEGYAQGLPDISRAFCLEISRRLILSWS